jgi:hypothetical protein
MNHQVCSFESTNDLTQVAVISQADPDSCTVAGLSLIEDQHIAVSANFRKERPPQPSGSSGNDNFHHYLP